MTTVDVAGFGISVRVRRSGEGPPAVFLHSAAGLSDTDPFVAALSSSHDLVAPVHPGFEELDDLDPIHDVHDLALYYDDLLGALGLESVPVIGHSFGGMIAAELAAHVPQRVSKLVLICPFGLWSEDHPGEDMFAAFPLTIHELLWADPSAHAPVPVAAGGDAMEPERLQMLLSLLQGMTAAGKFLWPLPDKGLARRLHRISAPTLVVWGAKDRLLPSAYADDFAALIPDARVEIVDDAGHMVTVEKPGEVAGVVTNFLDR